MTDTTSSAYSATPVEQLDRGQRERRQRLVEREVELQVDGQPDDGPALLVRLVEPLDDPAGQQRPVDRDGPADVPALRGRSSWLSVSRCRIAANASPPRAITLSSIACVTWKRRGQRLRLGGDQPVEGGLAPADVPSGGFLRTTLRRFFGSSPALARPLVLDDVLGRLHDDVPRVSKPARPGPAGDLVELAAFSSRVGLPSYLDSR
jgi:hypothetical protein